ncbi:hypothetical protein N9L68_02645 [bacterium]|nr:hypothetical protein [bacterium]
MVKGQVATPPAHATSAAATWWAWRIRDCRGAVVHSPQRRSPPVPRLVKGWLGSGTQVLQARRSDGAASSSVTFFALAR